MPNKGRTWYYQSASGQDEANSVFWLASLGQDGPISPAWGFPALGPQEKVLFWYGHNLYWPSLLACLVKIAVLGLVRFPFLSIDFVSVYKIACLISFSWNVGRMILAQSRRWPGSHSAFFTAHDSHVFSFNTGIKSVLVLELAVHGERWALAKSISSLSSTWPSHLNLALIRDSNMVASRENLYVGELSLPVCSSQNGDIRGEMPLLYMVLAKCLCFAAI